VAGAFVSGGKLSERKRMRIWGKPAISPTSGTG
jgi:hypothetical protein